MWNLSLRDADTAVVHFDADAAAIVAADFNPNCAARWDRCLL
jgi:hypothetical protein